MSDSHKAHEPLEILIVEDDDDARASLRDILELDDHHVTAVATADAALEATRDFSSVDVILLDRKLPDGLAEELVPKFRSRAPDADLIVVTGYADLDASIAAMREGATDYIIKPLKPEALLASLRRIGQRRRIERQLHEERHFAEMILKTAEVIILILDAQGRILRFNPYLTELTGFALENVAGQDWFETFIPERDRKRIRQSFDQTVCEGVTRVVLNPVISKAGKERNIRWSNTTLRDDGQITGVLSVGLDVTDLVQAQERLLQSERLATIGQTMAGLAHESRNALQRMQTAAELLEDDLADNPQALRDLAKITRASNDLRDLLEEVRAYAAPIKLDRTCTSLRSIWRRAWSNLENHHGERTATLVEVYSGASDIEVHVDQRRLEQVFRNLFENAIDACGDNARISVSCEDQGDTVAVSVEDNGPGISEQHRSRVFNAFYTTKPSGTGLGLAIVHRIVDAHGGTIEVADITAGMKCDLRLPKQG